MPIANLYAASLATGSLSTPNNALGAPNGTYTTDGNGTNSWIAGFNLDPLADNIRAVGTQTLSFRVRKGSNNGNPSINTVTLFQNGVALTTFAALTGNVTSTAGQIFNTTFDGSLLSGLNNLVVEINTSGVGGRKSDRNGVELDYIQLAANYEEVLGTTISAWNGSAFVAGVLQRWNGSAWVSASATRWNGSAWVAT